MKIKEQFLNEKSLKPYGFKKTTIDAKRGIYEYTREDEYAITFIQGRTGDIAIVMPEDDDGGYCDCTNLPDVVYHLIMDGLVEAEALKKKVYQIDELSKEACQNAIENMTHFIIKQVSEKYGIKGYNMLELATQLRLRFDENGYIEETTNDNR